MIQRDARLQRLYDALAEMGRIVGRLDDPRRICAEICRLAVEAAGFQAAWIGLLDQARTAVMPLAAAGPLSAEIDITRVEVRRPASDGMLNTALHEARTVVVGDARDDPLLALWQDRVAAVGYRSAAGLPILIDGQVVGLGFFCSAEPRAFGPQEVQLLERVMDDLAYRLQALEREAGRRVTEAERDRLAAVVEQATDSVLMKDPDGRVTYANPGFSRILGYPREQIMGRRPRDVLRSGDRDPELDRAMDAALASGGGWSGRVVDRRADGTPVEIDLVISPLRDGTGAVVGSLEIGRDVSREVALEAQLRQAHKLEAVGRLAGGIAHDFNNQLTAISGFGGLLAAALPPDGPEARDLGEILRAADRATALTRQLLAFSRRSVLEPRVVDLASVLQRITPMLRRLIGEDVHLVVRAEPGVGRALADPAQLEEVIVNLALNARDAMPDGGALILEAATAEMDAEFVAGHPGAEIGRYVLLAVSDTGHGMSRGVLEHIFEPFFTTKGPGKGTGLGLSMVFGFVKQSKGYVSAYSEPGRGSTFKVYLPRVDAPADASGDAAVRPAARRGTETILVVEDEEAVRRFACRVLERHGYRVLPAASGAEAVALASTFPERIDLLFSDIVMPGLSGPQVALELLATRPDVRLLYASGYTEEAALQLNVLGPGIPFLAKPYTADALLAQVRAVLDDAKALVRRPMTEFSRDAPRPGGGSQTPRA